MEDIVIRHRERFQVAVSVMAPKLWSLRTLSRTSRRELAEELGISISRLQAWETRRKRPPVNLFYRWCDLLGA